MPDHAKWMNRCLDLALRGGGSAAPNPMVGAVLVEGDRILAEGWHERVGEAHAEVNCLRGFGEDRIPEEAILYVNLEPCSHHGRTPPCADLLIARGVKHVVIAQVDPYPAVAGKGIERLRGAGVEVTVGIEERHSRWINRRFLTSIDERRPYITLKWASSADGFLDRQPRESRGVQRISDPATDVLVHRWRTEEQAILVGSRTVVNDDPHLTVRHVEGRSPLRVLLDRAAIAPVRSRVFDGSTPTLLFTTKERNELSVEQVEMANGDDPIGRLLAELHTRGIRSVMVEGGAELLGHFMARGLWDEARVITGAVHFANGSIAPSISAPATRSFAHAVDRIDLFVNPAHRTRPDSAWHWC